MKAKKRRKAKAVIAYALVSAIRRHISLDNLHTLRRQAAFYKSRKHRIAKVRITEL